jgi:hypothetical protein
MQSTMITRGHINSNPKGDNEDWAEVCWIQEATNPKSQEEDKCQARVNLAALHR